MQKIPTIFCRDETRKGHPVTDQVKPECQWVLDGEGVATKKIDGTNIKIENGTLWKRQKPKDRDYDAASYVPCRRDDTSDRWAWEAFDALPNPPGDGIYELVGPKVQGNPHQLAAHKLVRVVPPDESLAFQREALRTFSEMRDTLSDNPHIEGIVFHHPDGRMAKIKRRDYGLQWPIMAASSPDREGK